MSASDGKWPVAAPLWLGGIALAILVGGFGIWAMTATLSGAIIASGQIEVDRNRQIVQHPDGGVVAEILVEEGDLVAADQALLRLDPTILQSELSVVEGQLFEIMARRGRLEAERDEAAEVKIDPILAEAAAQSTEVQDLIEGQRRLFQARAVSLQQKIEQLLKRRTQIADQIVGIKAQQEALQIQFELISQELEAQQSLLDRGLAQVSRVLALQREEAALAGQMGELTAGVAQSEGRITEIDLEILQLASVQREEAITTLRDLQFNELELRERRRTLREQLSRQEIRAPVAGIVYGMSVVTPRSVIRPADPIMFLVPQDRPLIIAAQVEPVHIDEVFVGQDVTLRLSALDAQSTPELTGRVTQISADAFEDEATRIPYYRAEVVLTEGQIARLPEGSTLIPGMPVETFIRTEDRTPLAYLVKPLSDYFVRAFRES